MHSVLFCLLHLFKYILICTLKTYACNVNTKPPATHNTYYIHTLQHTISFYLLTAKQTSKKESFNIDFP